LKKTSADVNRRGFLLSLFNVSLIFFLFSYHVHEKSIMLPVLPALLLFPWYPYPTLWFVSVASLSLYPLLLEEGSNVALISTTAIFILTAYQLRVFHSRGVLLK
jgi:alpha-1,3-glucosyltransferase